MYAGAGERISNDMDDNMAAANNGNPKSNRSKEPVPPLVIEQVAEASEPPASRKVATVDERQSEHDDASPRVSNEAAEN